MKKSADIVPPSEPERCSDSLSSTVSLCLQQWEGCSGIAVAVTVLLAGAVLINSWWLHSFSTEENLFPSSNGNSAFHLKEESCDFFRGAWVADPRSPLYNNNTCRYIYYEEDCMTNGRPDWGFLYWRWRPVSCELPPFDAHLFLQSMKHKNMIFVGDSIAFNHMESLLCALVQAEDPQEMYYDVEDRIIFKFLLHNVTIAYKRSVFLVNYTYEGNMYHMHLDMPDVGWTDLLAVYDFAIISTSYWYFRSSVYYMNNKTLGTSHASKPNTTVYDMYDALKIAWKTVLNYMLNEFTGITIMRTVTVPHFGGDDWYKSGNCSKTQPLFDPLMQEPLPWTSQVLIRIQLQAFSQAMDYIEANNIDPKRLRLLNITYSSFLRPDGHPGPYRIQRHNEPSSDCLHWCLPGPIDMWNQILLQMLLH